MLPDRKSTPGPLTYESGALPIALRDPAKKKRVIMPPTSEKLRGHIGLGISVRLSVRNTFWQLRNSRTAYARILKLNMWHVHEK